MAFLTTNPSPYIINQPELTNVITSASGVGALSNSVSDLLAYVNTANASVQVNQLGSFNTNTITVTNNLNLSNSAILINGSNALSGNAVNGTGFLGLQVNQTEVARATPIGLGISVIPTTNLDVNGNTLVRGSLYISSMGAAVTSTLGYLYADGDIFARSVLYPSDPRLKTDVLPYKYGGVLPTPVEFTWKRDGRSDIGVLADDVARIEPHCVCSNASGGLTVDYPKLSVLCLAELHNLRSTVAGLSATVADLVSRT
jgi:hypothetical protein